MSGRHALPRRSVAAAGGTHRDDSRLAVRRGPGRRAGGGSAARGARPWTPVIVALVGALGLVGGLGTQAYWNDVETVSGATVTSGSLDLKVEGQDSYTWAALSMTNMAPGESTAESVTLTNSGTTPFTLSATAAATGSDANALVSQVTMLVRLADTATSDVTYPRQETCSTAGTVTYNDQAVTTTPVTVVAGPVTVQPGDSTTVCVRLTLSPSAGNTLQGKTYTPSFVFTAVQVTP